MSVGPIPNFKITPLIMEQMKSIDGLITLCKGIENRRMGIRLRKTSKIRSINSSLSIEGNSFDELEVRDIINGKPVIGPYDEIVEVQNAIGAYDAVLSKPLWDLGSFLEIYELMMGGLVERTGFRECDVGIFEGENEIYKAPSVENVVPLMDSLLDWCKSSDYPLPITAAVCHFYIESVHPFVDGNGRMGRIWHYLTLHRYNSIFDLIPIESKIELHQSEYYGVLERCQKTNPQDCTEFIEFSLNLCIELLNDLMHLKDERISGLLLAMGDEPMTSNQIMKKMGFSSKPYFLKHYLHPAIEYGFVSMTYPDAPRSHMQRYRKNVL